MTDLYKTLGVSPKASEAEIKKAYRTLARKYHPDANHGEAKAEERFKEISHAHDVLTDSAKRREYDTRRRFGGMGRGPAAGAGRGGGPGAAGGFGSFADMMGSIFGTRGGGESSSDGRASARRGIDVEVDIRLSFDQAMTGVQIPVAFDRRELCSTCSGSGAKAGTAPRLCPECKGRGVRGRDAGSFALSEPCTRCSGNGTVIDDPCGECSGRGTIARSARERVRIPAGVRDGTRVRKKGRGQSGARGGPAGDLIAVTRVSDSRLFSRKDDDLVVQVPVTFAEAALGGEVEVPTIDGRVKLVVPPGCHDGRSLRVSGHGAPRLKGGGRGDLIARLRIQVPRELSEEQQRALKEFASLDDRDPRETLFS